MFGSRLSRQRLTVDLFTPATLAIFVAPSSAIWLCNQLSILRASTLLRVVELSICDTSSVLSKRAANQAALAFDGGKRRQC